MANIFTLDSLNTSGLLPKPMAKEIIQQVTEDSVVRKLAKNVPMPITGTALAVQTGQPQAGIVGEGQPKPVTNLTVGTKVMKPIKAAAIAYWSKEARMANPLGLLDFIQSQMAGAITRAFDLAVLHGKNAVNGQTISGVEYVNQTKNRVELGTAKKENGGISTDILSGYALVVGHETQDFDMTAFAADKRLAPELLSQTDTLGRPIYAPSINLKQGAGTLHGLPIDYSRAVSGKIGQSEDTKVRAFGGDFSQLMYGFAEDITFSRTDQATIMDGGQSINLWQNNMEAILVEAIFGWVIKDTGAFVAYEDKVQAAVAA